MTRNLAARLTSEQAAFLERTFAKNRAEFGGFVMEQTTSAEMIVPDVWADMMPPEWAGRLVFGQGGPDGGSFATVDNTLEGNPGDHIKWAKWTKLTDMEDVDETDVLVPEKLDTTEDEGPVIKEAGKDAEVTDRALLVGVGDPLAEVRRQFGVLTAAKVDKELYASAIATGCKTYDHTGQTTEAIDNAGRFGAGAVANALGKFGDDADASLFAGFVIHSKQRTDAFRAPEFISADKYGSAAVIQRGEIGNIYGVPIITSDRVSTYDLDGAGAGTALGYNSVLVKSGALWLFYKRRPVVETDRDILARSTVVTTNVHYVAGRKDDDGVCLVKTK